MDFLYIHINFHDPNFLLKPVYFENFKNLKQTLLKLCNLLRAYAT